MYIVFVFLLTILSAESKAITGKAFLCRDPDTGKLHTVNSSWPSSTFCGDYHCKLRKKNITENEFQPIRQINFTNFDIENDAPKMKLLLNDDDNIQRNKNSNLIDISQKEEENLKDNNLITEKVNSKLVNDDRYLTDNEIKTISAILHTVKKSDLEAIVEIYQLAQNIYDELDKTSPEALIQETVKDLNLNIPATVKSNLLNAVDTKRVSYWYDPISNIKEPASHNKAQPINTIKSNSKSKTYGFQTRRPTTPKPMDSPVPYEKTVTYFDGTLTNKDFGRLPYYYPLSIFQRASSYVHQPLIVSNTPYVSTTVKNTITPTTKTPVSKYQKSLKPPIYMAYPFFNVPHDYNWTFPQTLYQTNYVDAYEMSFSKGKGQNSNAVLMNPDLENIQELGVKREKQEISVPNMLIPDKRKEDKSIHDWQTDPISRTILDEVRAHIDKTRFLKPLSLRKKIKLEKVGRLVKLDESAKRNKRNSKDEDETFTLEAFEVYLDKTTCLSDTAPGFFRHGNLSQPFPKCCPQRIND